MVEGKVLLIGVLVGLSLQRLSELVVAKRNERWAREQGAIESGAKHYPLFIVLHLGWLIAIAVESDLRGSSLSPYWPYLALALSLTQGLRYWAIAALGRRWNTRILVIPGLTPLTRGPYRYLRHPNYVAVIIELAAFPLLFGAWSTALTASVLNALLLFGIRIPAEEKALELAASSAKREAHGEASRVS